MQAGYFSTAWSDIKNSPNWFGKMCLLALIGMIPIFGQIVIAGYAYGWARDIAWNIHAPMPAKIFGNEDGNLYSRGFFALVISFVFSLVALVFYALYAGVAYSGSGVGSMLLQLLQLAASIAGGVFALVGCMRMSIYARLSPGFQVKQIWKMIRQDTNGIARIVGMIVLVSLIMGLVLSMVFGVMFMIVFLIGGASVAGQLSTGADLEYLASDPSFWAALAPSMGLLAIVSLVVGFFTMVAGVFVQILSARAGGYWTRQFDVPAWGGQDDPLPFETRAQAAQAAYTAQQAPAQGQYNAYAQPGQAQQAQQAPYGQPQQAQQAPYGQAQPGAYQAGNPAAYQASDPSAYPATQAPDWVVQAKASAPAPQTDPYAAASQPAQNTYTGYGQAPQAAPAGQPYPQATANAHPAPAQPAAPMDAAAATPTPTQAQTTQVFQPSAGQPAATQPFSQHPDVSQPFDTLETPAAAPASQPSAFDAEQAQAPSRDMHHKLEAKPAPRWEKIDLDALNDSGDGSATR